MESWSSRAKWTRPALMKFSDGLVGAPSDCGTAVITSPNMEFVPQPILGRIEVKIRADGRFGIEDPIQWPQLLSFKYSHLSCILREPRNAQDPRKPIWWRPAPRDFIPAHGTIVSSLGTLCATFRQPLDRLVQEMSHRVKEYQHRRSEGLTHLNFCETSMRTAFGCLTFPATYRDLLVQVVNVQRYWLECDAWIHWNEEILPKVLKPPLTPVAVDHKLMGVFTSDPTAASKLFSGGIPVWFIRIPEAITSEMSIVSDVLLTRPSNIEVDTGSFGSTIYAGKAGDAHIAAVSMGGHTYIDIPKVFLSPQSQTTQPPPRESAQGRSDVLTPSTSQLGSAGPVRSEPRGSRVSPYDPRATKSSKATNPLKSIRPSKQNSKPSKPVANIKPERNKFVDDPNPLLPPPIPVWSHCMASVDQRAATQGKLGYFVPEPALIVGPSDNARKLRYLQNWLLARDVWYHLITHDAFQQEPLHQQLWRDYLNNEDLSNPGDIQSATGGRKVQVFALFQAIFPNSYPVIQGANPTFFGRSITSLEVQLCQEILWEVYEMGFRLELIAIDRILCPKGGDSVYGQIAQEQQRLEHIAKIFDQDHGIRVAALPTSNRGLAADDIRERVPALEAFRRVLIRWPEAQRTLPISPITHILSPDTLEMRERSIVQFYVNTFFTHSSRAPIVPHRFPLS